MKRSVLQIAVSAKAWRILRLKGALHFLKQLDFDASTLTSLNRQGREKIQALFVKESHDA